MPVGCAASLLGVIAQQHDAPRAELGGQCDRTRATVELLRELGPAHPVDASDWRHKLAGEGLPGLFQVLTPPDPVHGVQHIRPGRRPERRIRYNNSDWTSCRPVSV